jgi:hypothetical protein
MEIIVLVSCSRINSWFLWLDILNFACRMFIILPTAFVQSCMRRKCKKERTRVLYVIVIRKPFRLIELRLVQYKVMSLCYEAI